MAFSTPVGLSWDSPSPPAESVRTDGRKDVRMYGHKDGRSRDYYVTTKFSRIDRLIGYQISLAMELRWQALPARSATMYNFY